MTIAVIGGTLGRAVTDVLRSRELSAPALTLTSMVDDRDTPVRDGRSPAERVVSRGLGTEEGIGRPLSERARQSMRTVEAYLKGGDPPRWMQRLREIDRAISAERQRVARAYRALQRECGHDADLFARRWRTLAQSWTFDHLNELIAQHNDWFPIERDLPMDPRTGDYVTIHGRSYRRPTLGPAWVLQHFPPSPPDDAGPRL